MYAVTAVQDAYPQRRSFLTTAWQIDKKWQRAESGSCRPVLPIHCHRAGFTLRLAMVIIGFLAMLRPAKLEVLTGPGATWSFLKTTWGAPRAFSYTCGVLRPLDLFGSCLKWLHSCGLTTRCTLHFCTCSGGSGTLCLTVKPASRPVLQDSGATRFYTATENILLLAWRGGCAAQVLLTELTPANRAASKAWTVRPTTCLLSFLALRSDIVVEEGVATCEFDMPVWHRFQNQ